MERIRLKDKEFVKCLSSQEISKAISVMSYQIHHDYVSRSPVFIVVLKGAFIFAAELIKNLEFNCEIQFVKAESYSGTGSTGNVKLTIDSDLDLKNRHVIIVEDIIDTGLTFEKIYNEIELRNPASIKVATLFFKPGNLKYEIEPDWHGFEMNSEFIVGYGLDYEGYGRNLSDLYKLA